MLLAWNSLRYNKKKWLGVGLGGPFQPLQFYEYMILWYFSSSVQLKKYIPQDTLIDTLILFLFVLFLFYFFRWTYT